MDTSLAAVFDIGELLDQIRPHSDLPTPAAAVEQLLAHELSRLFDLPFTQDHALKIRYLAYIRQMEDQLRRKRIDLLHYFNNPFLGQPTGDASLTLELSRTLLIMRTLPHATHRGSPDRHFQCR